MEPDEVILDTEERMEKAVENFHNGLNGLRTGRATPGLVDSIRVDYYGSPTPLKQVATISVPEARLISVQVWDRSMAQAVERAIRESSLGLNPVVEGQQMRIPIPELNAERRQELVKVAHKYAEHAKVSVRHVRRDGMDELKKAESGGMSQDESRSLSDRVQKLTDEKIADIDAVLGQKEAEITQV